MQHDAHVRRCERSAVVEPVAAVVAVARAAVLPGSELVAVAMTCVAAVGAGPESYLRGCGKYMALPQFSPSDAVAKRKEVLDIVKEAAMSRG